VTHKEDVKTCRECGRLINPGDSYCFIKPRKAPMQFYCRPCIKKITIKKKEDKQ